LIIITLLTNHILLFFFFLSFNFNVFLVDSGYPPSILFFPFLDCIIPCLWLKSHPLLSLIFSIQFQYKLWFMPCISVGQTLLWCCSLLIGEPSKRGLSCVFYTFRPLSTLLIGILLASKKRKIRDQMIIKSNYYIIFLLLCCEQLW